MVAITGLRKAIAIAATLAPPLILVATVPCTVLIPPVRLLARRKGLSSPFLLLLPLEKRDPILFTVVLGNFTIVFYYGVPRLLRQVIKAALILLLNAAIRVPNSLRTKGADVITLGKRDMPNVLVLSFRSTLLTFSTVVTFDRSFLLSPLDLGDNAILIAHRPGTSRVTTIFITVFTLVVPNSIPWVVYNPWIHLTKLTLNLLPLCGSLPPPAQPPLLVTSPSPQDTSNRRNYSS